MKAVGVLLRREEIDGEQNGHHPDIARRDGRGDDGKADDCLRDERCGSPEEAVNDDFEAERQLFHAFNVGSLAERFRLLSPRKNIVSCSTSRASRRGEIFSPTGTLRRPMTSSFDRNATATGASNR